MNKQQNALLIAACVIGGAIAGGSVSWFLLRTAPSVGQSKISIGKESGASVELGIDDTGVAYVHLSDKAGKPRISLEAGEDPTVQVKSADDPSAVALSRTPKGYGLMLVGEDGNIRAGLLNSGNNSSLEFYGNGNALQAQLASSEEENSLSFFGKDEKPRLAIISSDSDNNLTLVDKDGKPRAVLGTNDLIHQKTGTTEHTAESTLVLFDNKGNSIGQLPFWAR